MAALVVTALLVPWVAAALLVPRVTAPADATAPPTSGAALATMLLRPSAAAARPAPPAPRRLDAAGRPRRIVVPALDVDAAVVPISGANGTLLPPSDAQSIGWWREGSVPGAAHGAALLTGHTVHTGGGAFDDLGRLRTGDQVLVRTAHGWLHYAVTQTATYRKGRLALAAAGLFGRSGPGRLVLVTCSKFDGRKYLANTVVGAVPVSG